MLDRAISIVAQAFEGKYDKGGHPYVLHCLRVMDKMPKDDEELRCAAVMHDLLEDTSGTTSICFIDSLDSSNRLNLIFLIIEGDPATSVDNGKLLLYNPADNTTYTFEQSF